MNYKCQNRSCREPIETPGKCTVCQNAWEETCATAQASTPAEQTETWETEDEFQWI